MSLNVLPNVFENDKSAIIKLSENICAGRVVISQEGGYSETHLPFCGLAVIEELVGGKKRFLDPVRETIIHQGGEILSEIQKFMISTKI